MKILSQYRDALIDSIIFLYPKMNYTYLDVFPVLQETQKKARNRCNCSNDLHINSSIVWEDTMR